jgi:hypothetical protein
MWPFARHSSLGTTVVVLVGRISEEITRKLFFRSVLGDRQAWRLSSGRRSFFALEGLLNIFLGFVLRTLSVVVGLQGLAVFVYGTLSLASDVKDLAQLNVAPDLGPARLTVSVEGRKPPPRGSVQVNCSCSLREPC